MNRSGDPSSALCKEFYGDSTIITTVRRQKINIAEGKNGCTR
jgi:hypothetical protein